MATDPGKDHKAQPREAESKRHGDKLEDAVDALSHSKPVDKNKQENRGRPDPADPG